MVTAGNHQSRLRKLAREQSKRLDHEFQALVGSPLTEGKNARRIAAAGKVRELRTARQDSMRAQVHVVVPVLVIQDFSIARHQHGNRICQQQHARRDRACSTIEPLVAYTGILEIDCIHEVMQRNVRVLSAKAGEKRGHQSAERYQWPPPECAEKQIEPDDVRLQAVHSFENVKRTPGIVERPAPHNRKALRLDVIYGKLIRKHGEAEKWIAL